MATDNRIPVWLDCDPGHDDTFAILLAAYHPSLRLLGISTVWGNASLEKTTYNATSILTAISASHRVPVYIGASKALHRPPMHAPTDIHGESGIDGTSLLPVPTVLPNTAVPAVDAMAAALRAQPAGAAWVVATGSFTNAAALFQTHPDLVAHIAGLSLMGGAVGGGFTDAVLGSVDGVPRIGNWTQWAEFNVLADPEAAQAIFGDKELAGKTTLIPLDVSHLVLGTREVRALLLHGPEGRGGKGEDGEGEEGEIKGKTTLRTMLVELLMFFAKTYSDVFGITAGPPLHDPIAVAAILTGVGEARGEIPFYDYKEDDANRKERYQVTVVTEGSYDEARAGKTRTGQVVATLLPPGEQGVRIPRNLDVSKFWTVLEECVSRADEANAAAAAGGK